ncbi:hypothetical protein AOA14_03425 [Sphingopyxis terrae subsp. terrae NBRC 15098]|uniref:Uncharacterized protein n=1 Tax=Sphingopyxis terrae subsp. terrae NBRC 15098 TaxID=1219058 RepID=A0A142VV39_9SPHN|nr:hypothetical protein AOA14_03425 [Sphingopyxis terrae subsp. terrae NBRC 15098]
MPATSPTIWRSAIRFRGRAPAPSPRSLLSQTIRGRTAALELGRRDADARVRDDCERWLTL